jgi:hypothetical protein
MKFGRKSQLWNRMRAGRGKRVKQSFFKSGNTYFYLKVLWKELVKRKNCLQQRGPGTQRRVPRSENERCQGGYRDRRGDK